MQYLVNATFFINAARADFNFIENLKFSTIQPVLDEVALQIGLNIDIILDIETINEQTKPPKIKIAREKLMKLSSVDQSLLGVAFERKKNIILVTDDRLVRQVAKANLIRCLTTPKFIAYLVNRSILDKKGAIEFLEKVRPVYIRKKEVDSAIDKMNIWK